jgi:iron complex transport system ATP-binding protein
MIGIIGPNGSGKSTLLKIAAGLLRPNEGITSLFDRPMGRYTRREIARYVAYVPQETPSAFGFTAGSFVLFGRRPYHGPWPFDTPRDEELASEAMRATETDSFAGRPLVELSGGERQRVVIAAALAQEPSVMLLDEPTASLDLRYQIQILEILTRLNRERTITVVVVTHDLNHAALFFGRVIVLSDGRVVADGAPRDVLTPALVREVYHVGVSVGRHPDGTPMLVPFPDSGAGR